MKSLFSATILLACLAIGHLFHRLLIPSLFTVLCLYLLACRFGRWVAPGARRLVAALVLLVCTPRPIDGRLYKFCKVAND